jgi:hypothetical protein
VTLRLTTLLADAQDGRLVRGDFPYGDIGRFFPIAAPMYKELFQGLGRPQRLELVEREELGDDRVFVYDVRFPGKAFRVRVGIAPDDRVANLHDGCVVAHRATSIAAHPSNRTPPRC